MAIATVVIPIAPQQCLLENKINMPETVSDNI